MVAFYKWMGIVAILLVAAMAIPAMFSMKSDAAVMAAIILLAAMPGLVWLYVQRVFQKPQSEKVQ